MGMETLALQHLVPSRLGGLVHFAPLGYAVMVILTLSRLRP